ncbi:GCG_CRPN prefix-to-repeats domain-containing protein [Methylobacterium oryzisoli]|uniref:GCG_CRPN prefix-to-repeats domain-containing protein n=1 Tax=Methylobacterium oryzisoli TaxID=3385502 RepID=UPI00389292D5
MTNSKIMALAIVAGTLGFASAASAAPGAVAQAGVIAGDAQVQNVAMGCGPGWAPNAWGNCRPMYRPYGYGYRPYGYGYGYRPYGYGYGHRPFGRPSGIAVRFF